MDAREERLARNELLFRDVNEGVELVAIPMTAVGEDRVYEFFCECSNIDCTLHLPIRLSDYEQVRSDSTQFLVAPGHELPEIEEVVLRTDDYQFVRKRGDAAELAAESDRRSR